MSQQSRFNRQYFRIASEEEANIRKKIHISDLTEFVTVYFKEAYKNRIIYYNIPINWSMNYFLHSVIEWLKIDFNITEQNINRHNQPCSVIDIIEMCQEIPHTNSEDAPKLCLTPETSEETFREIYTTMMTNKCPGFYFKVNL